VGGGPGPRPQKIPPPKKIQILFSLFSHVGQKILPPPKKFNKSKKMFFHQNMFSIQKSFGVKIKVIQGHISILRSNCMFRGANMRRVGGRHKITPVRHLHGFLGNVANCLASFCQQRQLQSWQRNASAAVAFSDEMRRRCTVYVHEVDGKKELTII